MGYEFHITRAQHWSESETAPITREEWLAVVEADPELRIDTNNGPDDFLWFGPNGDPEGIPFWWNEGEIKTKHPDQATVRKMIALASLFGAKVEGDDGETYSSVDNWPHHDGWANRTKASSPWWRFWSR